MRKHDLPKVNVASHFFGVGMAAAISLVGLSAHSTPGEHCKGTTGMTECITPSSPAMESEDIDDEPCRISE